MRVEPPPYTKEIQRNYGKTASMRNLTLFRSALRAYPVQPMHIVLSSLLLYGAACCLPALIFKDTSASQGILPNYSMCGLRTLLEGALCILLGSPRSLAWPWLANLFGLLSLAFFLAKRYQNALLLSGIAFLFAVGTYSLIGREFPLDDDSDSVYHLLMLGSGFYAWLASILILAMGSFLLSGRSGSHRAAASCPLE